MKTSLYIFNDRLAAVVGRADGKRIRVKSFAEAMLPEGSVINGVVTNESGFCAGIEELKKALGRGAFNKVSVTTGSSLVFLKRSVVPKQPKKKLMEWVSNEFSDVETPDDPLLFDMTSLESLGPDKGEAALLAACKQSLVTAYDELLKSCGARLTGVDTIHVSMLKLLRAGAQTRGKTFILLAFDGNILDATLYVSGQYRFFNRTRLFSRRGTTESFTEIERAISAILQFNAAERSGETVQAIYYTGQLHAEDEHLSGIGTAFNLTASELPFSDGELKGNLSDFAPAGYAAALGNLIAGPSEVNFLEAMRQVAKREKNVSKKVLLALPAALTAVLLLGAYGYLLVGNIRAENRLHGLEKEISDLTPAFDEASALAEYYNTLSEEYEGLRAGRVAFSIFPELSNDLFTKVSSCTKGRFIISTYSFDENERLLTLQATVDSVNEVPGFAERLRDTNHFEEVSYTGYTSDQGGVYYCTVYCILHMPDFTE